METHDGKMPNCYRGIKTIEMTEEERYEANLYARWIKSQERKALEECAGIPLEEIAKRMPEYVEYIDKIEKLRSYGLGDKKKTAYEEIIEWLETHDGKMPKGCYSRIKTIEMTERERYERNLYARWKISQEGKALDACVGIPIEEIAEKKPEYVDYIEQIRELREHGQMGKQGAKRRMKKSVGKHVGDNADTREQLKRELEERVAEQD